MSTAEADSHRGLFIKVWFGLLILTLVEIVLAYIHFNPHVMLAVLMGLSLVKAGMIMAYFMHRKFDAPSLSWILVVPLIACIMIMVGYFFPDGYRILQYGVANIK
jgi:cytochrome c oxidase subunit 4